MSRPVSESSELEKAFGKTRMKNQIKTPTQEKKIFIIYNSLMLFLNNNFQASDNQTNSNRWRLG
jgi:hypothetical protein